MGKLVCAILAVTVLVLGPALPSEAASSGHYRGAPSSGFSRGGAVSGYHHGAPSSGYYHGAAWHGGYHGGGGHGHFGVVIGAPFWGWGWGWGPWGYPYGYYNPPVVVEQQAPVYVQPEAQTQYWYYCQSAQGYYPYVQQCPGGWMQVVPPAAPPR